MTVPRKKNRSTKRFFLHWERLSKINRHRNAVYRGINHRKFTAEKIHLRLYLWRLSFHRRVERWKIYERNQETGIDLKTRFLFAGKHETWREAFLQLFSRLIEVPIEFFRVRALKRLWIWGIRWKLEVGDSLVLNPFIYWSLSASTWRHTPRTSWQHDAPSSQPFSLKNFLSSVFVHVLLTWIKSTRRQVC